MSLVTVLEAIKNGPNPSFDYQLHDCLTDNADWNADNWEMVIPHVEDYCSQLREYFDNSVHGIIFQAVWVGEKPSTVVKLGIDDFLKLVRKSMLGTKTKYVVEKST